MDGKSADLAGDYTRETGNGGPVMKVYILRTQRVKEWLGDIQQPGMELWDHIPN